MRSFRSAGASRWVARCWDQCGGFRHPRAQDDGESKKEDDGEKAERQPRRHPRPVWLHPSPVRRPYVERVGRWGWRVGSLLGGWGLVGRWIITDGNQMRGSCSPPGRRWVGFPGVRSPTPRANHAGRPWTRFSSCGRVGRHRDIGVFAQPAGMQRARTSQPWWFAVSPLGVAPAMNSTAQHPSRGPDFDR